MSTLIAYLQTHGVRAWTQEGRLMAEDVYADSANRLHREAVELCPTFRAVRAFLGYGAE